MQYGLYICYFFLLFLSFVLASSAVPGTDENTEIQNNKNCKTLCEHCGCKGFYCGEECICECDSDNKEDMECLAAMQSNCKKLNIPFEVLIQGPSENRFVRNALLLDQGIKQSEIQEPRAKRSTALIYKPGLKSPLANALVNIRKAKIAERSAAMRNITNTLAELKAQQAELKSHKRRGVTSFMDDNFIVSPAPRIHLPSPPQDLLGSASEHVLAAIPPPSHPGKNIKIGTAVAKMREALINLNAKTEQLLSATQPGGGVAHKIPRSPKFANLFPSAVTPAPAAPMGVQQMAYGGSMNTEERPILKALFGGFPMMNNLLNN